MTLLHAPSRFEAIDTVLVDMDGTLLDLAFDNYFWRDLVPAVYAERTGIALEEARLDITSRYDQVTGRLAWYCLDHWSRELGLDLAELKWSHRHLIDYLPGATSFLAAVREAGKQLLIVTNAHPRAIAIKTAQTHIRERVDGIVCSHELGAPKESGEFWTVLEQRVPFDARRTLLVEDSLTVLAAARAYGIGHTFAISRPDSGQPVREIAGFPAVERIADLL